eukprot:g5517.t1
MPSSSLFTLQLKALLRKNVILIRRQGKLAVREFLVPVIFLVILTVLANVLPNTHHPEVLVNPAETVSLDEFYDPDEGVIGLAPCSYADLHPGATASPPPPPSSSPSSSSSSPSIVDRLRTLLAGRIKNVTCFATSDALLSFAKTSPAGMVAGAAFSPPTTAGGALGVTIYLNKTAGAAIPTSNVSSVDGNAGRGAFVGSGFLAFQSALQSVVIETQYAGVDPVALAALEARTTGATLRVREFPHRGYWTSTGTTILEYILPIYLTLVFAIEVRMLLTRLLTEKEKRLKEGMLMVGLAARANWCSWFITSGVKSVLFSVLVAVVGKVGGLFRYSDPVIVGIMCLLFSFTCITFSFIASSFFSTARVGGVLGYMLFFLCSLPALALKGPGIPPWAKILSSVLSPCAFSFATEAFNDAEGRGTGLQWATIADPQATDLGVPFYAFLAALLFDVFFYAVAAAYCEQVVANDYGTTRHCCFCLGFRRKDGTGAGHNSIVAGKGRRRGGGQRGRGRGAGGGGGGRSYSAVQASLLDGNEDDDHMMDGDGDDLEQCAAGSTITTTTTTTTLAASASSASSAPSAAAVEAVPAELEPRRAVTLRGMVKVYPSKDGLEGTRAVDGVDLAMYEGQILALLGHNGAGKSTLIGMLTGLFPPTAGDTTVYGHSLRNDMAAIRRLVGVCPQHDVLFDTLTCEEHLRLFGAIKGLADEASVAAEAARRLADVDLSHKAGAQSKHLSGGEKRRLSLAIALMGDPKVVYLDEPTSGMDAQARRQVWDLLERHREGRVIVLTTHFMDEADILGDRIAIMSRGKLQCVGSSLFLKSRFGLGYHLVLNGRGGGGGGESHSSSAMAAATASTMIDIDHTTALVRKHVPEARLVPSSNAVEYLLPTAAASTEGFGDLFDELDATAGDLGIEGYGVNQTSLEEVFLRLAHDDSLGGLGGLDGGLSTAADSLMSSSSSSSSYRTIDLEVQRDENEEEQRAHAHPGHHPEQESKAHGPNGTAGATTIHGTASHSPLSSSATTLASAAVADPPARTAGFCRQLRTLFRRRLRVARRDKRVLFQQCVLPIIFVAISTAFGGLQNIAASGGTSPAILSPATFAPALASLAPPPPPSALPAAFYFVGVGSSGFAKNLTGGGVGLPASVSGGSGGGGRVVERSASLATGSAGHDPASLAMWLLGNASCAGAWNASLGSGGKTTTYDLWYNATLVAAMPVALSQLGTAMLRTAAGLLPPPPGAAAAYKTDSDNIIVRSSQAN